MIPKKEPVETTTDPYQTPPTPETNRSHPIGNIKSDLLLDMLDLAKTTHFQESVENWSGSSLHQIIFDFYRPIFTPTIVSNLIHNVGTEQSSEVISPLSITGALIALAMVSAGEGRTEIMDWIVVNGRRVYWEDYIHGPFEAYDAIVGNLTNPLIAKISNSSQTVCFAFPDLVIRCNIFEHKFSS